MAKTELFGRWLQGSVVVEDQGKSTGERFFVHAGTGSNTTGSGRTPTTPFASLAYAVTRCTAGRHDIIYLMPGHTETVATTITPLAHTRIVGLGTGNQVAQLTPAAANLVAITVSAANVTVENVYFNESTVASTVTVFAITGRHCHLRGLHMDLGAEDRIGIRVGALGCYPIIEDCVVQVTADGPDSWISFVSANVDMPLIRNNRVIGSDATDEFDVGIVDFGAFAVRNPIVIDNVFDGADIAVNSIADAGAVVGDAFVGNKHAGLATNNDTVPVGHMNIFDGAITADKIAADALANAKFADNAISAAKIANNAITADKVATNALTRAKFALSAGEITTDGVVVSRATEALPQTAVGALFVVTGHVVLKRILGEVTTAVGNVANATKLQLNPDGTGATTDLCGTLDIDNDAVGTTYEITGTAANAMVDSVNLPKNPAQLLDVLLVPGVVEINCAGSDGGGGRVRWSMVYVPLEEGAHVVTA